MLVRIALSVLLLGLAMPASAQLYKWLDPEGRVHYTDQPPPPDAKQDQKLNIKKTQPGTVPAPSSEEKPASQSYQERELEFKKRKVEQEQSQAKATEQEKQEQDLCRSARQRLATFQEAGRVYSVDEKGERVYTDDAARQRYLDEAQQDIAKHCK